MLILTPAAYEVDGLLKSRRLPASALTLEQQDGARELIDLGFARTFRDGREEWLETIVDDLDDDVTGDDNLEGQRRSDVLDACERLELALEEEVDGQLVVPVPGAPVGSLEPRRTLF